MHNFLNEIEGLHHVNNIRAWVDHLKCVAYVRAQELKRKKNTLKIIFRFDAYSFCSWCILFLLHSSFADILCFSDIQKYFTLFINFFSDLQYCLRLHFTHDINIKLRVHRIFRSPPCVSSEFGDYLENKQYITLICIDNVL